MSNETYTLSIDTENSPGVLHRLTVLFTRRKINIDSLTVSETERHSISRFTIVAQLPPGLVDTLVKQISRIIEVQRVYASKNEDLIYKEIAFFKVRTAAPEKRIEIEELSRRHDGSIIFVDRAFVIIEQTGSEEDISSLFLLLEPFGMDEFVRSGRIAIRKRPLAIAPEKTSADDTSDDSTWTTF